MTRSQAHVAADVQSAHFFSTEGFEDGHKARYGTAASYIGPPCAPRMSAPTVRRRLRILSGVTERLPSLFSMEYNTGLNGGCYRSRPQASTIRSDDSSGQYLFHRKLLTLVP